MVAVLQPLKQGKVIPIDRAVVMVGRGSDCDAIITDSQKISRRHCCLVQVDNAYYIRDLGSMNGIWVNGKRVSRESPMQLGDKVQIGDVEFQFHPNARIESKRTVVSDAAAPEPTIAPGAPAGEADAPDDPNAAGVLPSGDIPLVEPRIADDVSSPPEEEFEVIDDVVPLEDDDAYLLETNEVEIIDQPIVDEGVAEAEIVEAELVDAEVVEAEILEAEIIDAEIVETETDDDEDDEIIIFED